MTSRLGRALAEAASEPAVALALDRLLDELTVAQCTRTSQVPVHPDRATKQYRPVAQRVLLALSYGPLKIQELFAEAYPWPSADPDEQHLRLHRVWGLLERLIRDGVVERLGHAHYAALGVGRRQKRDPRRSDLAALLRDPRPQHPDGLTARECARKLDWEPHQVRQWLKEIRDGGQPLTQVRNQDFVGAGREYRYRITQPPACTPGRKARVTHLSTGSRSAH